jgi:hypothetical protein
MKTTTEISIHRTGDNPIYGESVIRVRIVDEGAGPFIEIEQEGSKVQVELDDLTEITEAARWLLDQPAAKEADE